jgi:hypothetical protein
MNGGKVFHSTGKTFQNGGKISADYSQDLTSHRDGHQVPPLTRVPLIKNRHLFVFVTGKECVSCEVGTEFLNIIYKIFSFKTVNIIQFSRS